MLVMKEGRFYSCIIKFSQCCPYVFQEEKAEQWNFTFMFLQTEVSMD